MPLAEVEKLFSSLPRFRSVQIFKWIASGARSFSEMRNLPLPLREDLSERFFVRPETVVKINSDNDGTAKMVFQFEDRGAGNNSAVEVEAVLLSDRAGRRTACLSTQAGCPMKCVFCKTGSAGFLRNLDSAEIVEQFFQLKEFAEKREEESAAIGGGATGTAVSGQPPLPVSNIVVMGMGEPLLNLAELRRAIAVITDPQGLNFSRRRITVSTCGIAEGIDDLADRGPDVRLALSLTTADESLRRRLMPVTENQSLDKVKAALRRFQDKGGMRITLEAALLGGINTRSDDAAAVAAFAKGLDVSVNLIPWNPVAGLEFEGKPLREPSAAEVESYAACLESFGLKVTRRFRRGRGVAGACGQLGHIPGKKDLIIVNDSM